MALSYDKLRAEVDDRIWYRANRAFAFLVDAPHTFGHSQLVLKVSTSDEEEWFFSKAAGHAAKCIRRLRTQLPRHRRAWRQLADYTKTKGVYKKTLILRVSADEEADTYKIHLVPYFASHLKSTRKLYQGTHDLPEKKTGGLLHWLGLREVLLDYDMRQGRTHATVKNRISCFKLDRLASALAR
jgi:hypothetical protein